MLKYREIEFELVSHVQNCILPWLGSPYVAGGADPKHGSDCLRSVAGIISTILNKPIDVEDLPQDVGMNNKFIAVKAMKTLRRKFMPNTAVRDNVLEAGDVLITKWKDGGPGHAMICGDNALYHCPKPNSSFCKTGFYIPKRQELCRIYRYDNRKEWLQS